jgi:transposase
MEVKILALEALDSGLSAQEVGELVGVGSGTIHKWRKDYTDGGVQGLCRKASSIAIRKQCSVLEEKIVARRRENPGHGVRRIRDDLRRQEGIEGRSPVDVHQECDDSSDRVRTRCGRSTSSPFS